MTLITKSVSGYKHLDLGNIKLAFTQVCKAETFRDVYFAANSLYYVESGYAILYSSQEKLIVRKGDICLIRQHSKLDIRKFRNEDGTDFKSILFYLFPDFVTEFIKQAKSKKNQPVAVSSAIIGLGSPLQLKIFCESLLPLFGKKELNRSEIREQTFLALNHLSQHNEQLLPFLAANSKPVKIDLYEFMIHNMVHHYSVPELATLTGRSLSSFKRDFNAVFGTSPHQWLLRKKIDYAAHLIRDQNMKSSDIYLMLGFNELSHFSATYKKIKGVVPSKT